MVITETYREVYGSDYAAINRHSTRRYEDENGNIYCLDRNLSGVPSFFKAFGPYKQDFIGILPVLLIGGEELWGDGISWKNAETIFLAEINRRFDTVNRTA